MFIFPMAGASSRFTKVGYKKPKYLLAAGQKTLFEHSISGFSKFFGKERFLFICLKGVFDDKGKLETLCEQQGLSKHDVIIIELDQPTDGQATTVYQGLKISGIEDSEPITIFNIDTVYSGFDHATFVSSQQCDGYLDVVEVPGDNWSFVLPKGPAQNSGQVLKVTEKERISDLCSTGLYYFKSCRMFKSLFEERLTTATDKLQGNERYIAPLYNLIIEKNGIVNYRKINSNQIQLAGTPEEYGQFVTLNGWQIEGP